METIVRQTLNKNNFNIFENLSKNSINLKHMLEDLDNLKKDKKGGKKLKKGYNYSRAT